MQKKWMIKTIGALLPLLGICLVGANVRQEERGQGVNFKMENRRIVALYQNSYALVIGVSEYSGGWTDLPGVRIDLTEVKKALETEGFQVELVLNPTYDQFQEKMNQFIKKYGYREENRLLVYYAGHGHTGKSADGRQMGYIVPADAPLPEKDNRGFRLRSVSMDNLVAYARQMETRHALFVFDSCFSGTLFTTTQAENNTQSISTLMTQPVRQFLTAGTDQQTVPDKSLFREWFVEGLQGAADGNQDGYVTASELSRYVQANVSNNSRQKQTPQYGKIQDDKLNQGEMVFLTGKFKEMKYWDTMWNSSNPTDYRTYLTKYLNGEYAEVARNRITRLERKPFQAQPAKQFTNSLGIKFVLVPAGTFTMGSNLGELDEKPHEVTISQPFYLGKFEVTQAQWQAVMGANPSYFKGDNLPVEQVSWDQVQHFIQRLNANGDGEYRLPTEAEWEYACRAGTREEYAGKLEKMGWYAANSGNRRLSDDGNWKLPELMANRCQTHPVGKTKPNKWDVYDMHGNVLEWCQDRYEKDYYSKSPRRDPRGPLMGLYRVYRGGSWSLQGSFCRSARRSYNAPAQPLRNVGFRLVRMVW